MSSNYRRPLSSLYGVNFADLSEEDLKKAMLEILQEGIHGLSFSVYLEGQGPGSHINIDQVRERMRIIQPYVKWIRSFSCVDGNDLIPKVAHEFGLKTLVGAWLGNEPDKNEEEIAAVIELAKDGHADIIAVGNEVLLRGDLNGDEIIDFIQRVKSEVPGIPVGYVDAYFEFANHPEVCDACDVILANCYPFWEGFPLEHSLAYMKNMYQIAKNAAQGKKVIISETGWPNRGSAEEAAVPSQINAMKYFINAYNWANDENLDIFYFSSFDETWKIDAEGDVGAYWGLWDKDGKFKFA